VKRLPAIIAIVLNAANGFALAAEPSEFQDIVRALEAQVPELASEYEIKPDIQPEQRHLRRYTEAGNWSVAKEVYVHWYERPKSESDWVLVAFDVAEAPAFAFLKSFAYDRKTKKLTLLDEPPFKPLPAEAFDIDSLGGWRTAYVIDENGNITIAASPAMAITNFTTARWHPDEGKFTLHKRATTLYPHNDDAADDTPEMEEYVKNVIRPNYQRIADNKRWTWVEKKEASDLSLEGAELTYYYTERGLEKIIAEIYGEYYANHVEYYFINSRLSFIHSQLKRYTQSPYDDGFDPKKHTKLEERRWYVKDDVCFRALGPDGKKLSPAEKKKSYLGEHSQGGEYSSYGRILRH